MATGNAHNGMGSSYGQMGIIPPHVRRVAWEWISLLSARAAPGSTRGLIGLLILLHRDRSSHLGGGMAFLYPQVRDNFPKYQGQIRRWKRGSRGTMQPMTYQRKAPVSIDDDAVMSQPEARYQSPAIIDEKILEYEEIDIALIAASSS